MTVDLNRPIRLVLPSANRVGHGPSLRSGYGKQPGRVIDVPRMLLLRRERCDDMIEMRPGPDQPRRHGRPTARLPVAPTALGVFWPVGVPVLRAGHPEGWAEALRDLLRSFCAVVAAGTPAGHDAGAPYPNRTDGARSVAARSVGPGDP